MWTRQRRHECTAGLVQTRRATDNRPRRHCGGNPLHNLEHEEHEARHLGAKETARRISWGVSACMSAPYTLGQEPPPGPCSGRLSLVARDRTILEKAEIEAFVPGRRNDAVTYSIKPVGRGCGHSPLLKTPEPVRAGTKRATQQGRAMYQDRQEAT